MTGASRRSFIRKSFMIDSFFLYWLLQMSLHINVDHSDDFCITLHPYRSEESRGKYTHNAIWLNSERMVKTCKVRIRRGEKHRLFVLMLIGNWISLLFIYQLIELFRYIRSQNAKSIDAKTRKNNLICSVATF